MDSTINAMIAVRMFCAFRGWTHQLKKPKTLTQA